MTESSAQPKRKAGNSPHPSRMYAYIPPVRGYAPATSARARAPQSAKSPPTAQTVSIGAGPGSFAAIPAGERKIPEPIVDPTRTATAVQRPILRGRAVRGGGAFMPGNVLARTADDKRGG